MAAQRTDAAADAAVPKPVPALDDLDIFDSRPTTAVPSFPGGAGHTVVFATAVEQLPRVVVAVPTSTVVPFDDASNSAPERRSTPAAVARRRAIALGWDFASDISSAPVRFYRRYCTILAAAAVVFAVLGTNVFVPLVTVCLLPSSLLVLFWLQRDDRFLAGGDLRSCANRDSSLIYWIVSLYVSAAVACVNLGFLIAGWMAGGTTSSNGSANHRHAHHRVNGTSPSSSASAAYMDATRMWETTLNVAVLPLVLLSVLAALRLRFSLVAMYSNLATTTGDGSTM